MWDAAMNEPTLEEEAENCRRRALAYLGRPEAPFLLRVAKAFEELAREPGTGRHRLR
jgi:hypothetical protein